MIRLISSRATHDEDGLYLHTVDGIDGPRMFETPVVLAGQAKLFAAWSGTGHALLLRGRQVIRCSEEIQIVSMSQC